MKKPLLEIGTDYLSQARANAPAHVVLTGFADSLNLSVPSVVHEGYDRKINHHDKEDLSQEIGLYRCAAYQDSYHKGCKPIPRSIFARAFTPFLSISPAMLIPSEITTDMAPTR